MSRMAATGNTNSAATLTAAADHTGACRTASAARTARAAMLRAARESAEAGGSGVAGAVVLMRPALLQGRSWCPQRTIGRTDRRGAQILPRIQQRTRVALRRIDRIADIVAAEQSGRAGA